MDVSAILTSTNLLLAAGIFVLITVLRVPFKSIFESRTGQRFLPLLPLALGVGGALLGACSNCDTWQQKVLIGLIAGFASSHFFKLGKTTVFGWGLPALVVEPVASAEPEKVVKAEVVKADPTPDPKLEPEPAKVSAVPLKAADVVTKPEKAARAPRGSKKKS